MIDALIERVSNWWTDPEARNRILGVLRRADDTPGGVQGMIVGERANVAPRRLYRTLRQLEAEGLIGRTEGMKSEMRGGRPRFYYRLTQRGREL